MSNCTNNFIKRVIGVTRTFKWTITTNGAAVPLVAEDLTLQLVPPRGEAVSLPFDVDDNIVSFTWQGEDQHIIGCYSLILWANYGEDNQRRVDIHNFVELIPWSDRQSGEYSDLVEETIELETADFGENIMVVDNLNSTSATDALSANMGRQLNVTKQDVIQDLATIRSGAAAGAAVKEWAKNDPLITDDATQTSASRLNFNGNLFEQWISGVASSITLKGIAGFLKLADISQWGSAYNDRMLPTVAAVKSKIDGKQDAIADLAAIRSGAEAGATAVQPGDLASINQALATIEAVIPSQASSSNKLTDKNYVDGAIATNTANFVGTFDTLAELQAVQNPTKNDYGFVIEQDAQGNEYYDRYKYTGSQWLFEYKVESTPFTTEQWAAIQSGITAALVSKLSALPTNAELNTALAGKQPVINDLTTIRSGAAAGATAYQKPSGGIPKTDLASAVQTSLGKADSAYQKPSSGIPASDMATAVQTSLGKADAAAPQATTYTKTEVDAALATKQTSSQIATINGSDITHGGNVTIVAAEGQTITIDAAPTEDSNNAVSSGGAYNAIEPLDTAINGTIEEQKEEITYNRSDGVKWALNSNGNYTYSGSNLSVFIPIEPSTKYSIKVPNTDPGNCVVGIIKTMPDLATTSSKAADFATGITGRILVTPGEEYEFTAPADAHYVSLGLKVTAGDVHPAIYSYVGVAVEGLVDKVASLENIAEELQGQIDDINIKFEPQTKDQILNLSSFSKTPYGIPSSTGTWNYGNNQKSIFIPVYDAKKVKIQVGSVDSVCAFLTDNDQTRGAMPHYSSGYGLTVLTANTTYEYDVPTDANFFWLLVHTSTSEVTAAVTLSAIIGSEPEVPSKQLSDVAAEIGNTLTPLSVPVDSSGYDIPQDLQHLNVWRKARQFTEIEWVPKNTTPKNAGTYPAGTTVKGLPYSSVKEIDKYIGYDVSFETFMTAVNNPYSLLYTENVSEDDSASAWGRTYHGENCAAYFGTVCTDLTSWCVGYPIYYDSALIGWLAQYALKAVETFDQGFYNVKVGDIMWKSGHCRVVVGIKRNSSGIMTHLQISESIGDHCRQRVDMGPSTFNSLMASENGIMYRSLELYKNGNYEPSPFVNVGDEDNTPYTYNDDICTFAGNKASFREGDQVVLNYNLTATPNNAWTHIEVYKDDVLLNIYALADIDQSTLAESQKNHALSLGESLTHGKYKARMTDGMNYSDYTYWEVIQADVTCSIGSDHMATIGITSANGTPIAIKVCDIQGFNYAFRELTKDEQNSSTFTADLVTLNKEQFPAKPIRGEVGLYLKIYFQGDYGRVTNIPLSIVF